jgi:hypothetical protein
MSNISPYDSRNKFIMVNPKYNEPTFFDSRDTPSYTCGLLSNIKRKLIINEHTYKTNGVGIKRIPNATRQIQYNSKNSVKIGNVIYIIPSRLCKYIDEIRVLAEQNIPFQTIVKIISEKYSVNDPLLSTIQPSNFNPKYRYSSYNKLYANYKNVADFSGPFRMGEFLTSFSSTILTSSLFPILSETQYVYVVCNDGIEYTTLVSDMKQNGKASFWGGKLSSNGNDLTSNVSIPVVIFPIDNVTDIMYGTLYTTNTTDSKLVFIPLTTLENFPIHKNYYENMLFNIKTYECYENLSIDYTKLKCIYNKANKLYTNS